MKPSETATRASAGHDKNQLMVHPFTNPGNLRARSGNLLFMHSRCYRYQKVNEVGWPLCAPAVADVKGVKD